MLSEKDTEGLRLALQDAVVKCSERCLYQSSKWAAELLNALPEPATADSQQPKLQELPGGFISSVLSPNADPDEAALEAAELNKYLLAKSFFDCREYDRCAAVFLPDTLFARLLSSRADDKSKSPASGPISLGGSDPRAAVELPNISQKSLFLALYAKLIKGEKRKDEEMEMVMGPQDHGPVVNKQLLPIGQYLRAWFDKATDDADEIVGSQGWLEYLYGMVLAKEKNEAEAMDWLIRSVHLYPMNWGCWLEMASLISRAEDFNLISKRLPQNIVSYMFHLHTSLELYQQGPNLAHLLEEILHIFPSSSFLLTCNAMLSYHSKELMLAEQNFSELLAMHPHRLDSLDHYSNILYVLNQRPKLAFLAQLCNATDPFRPESCVVVGNYYSLLSRHEKAVAYFRRALTLDRTCLSAWTLMGHEYVELKNTHAAIESYRRAVDVNRRDYRAWYGLGQTYEVLEMHSYALWYYKKAAGLRPWDGKMWMAVGSCLQKMGRDHDGIKALKRALLADSYYDSANNSFESGGDRASSAHFDPDILLQIALMYDRIDEEEEAKEYMQLCLTQEDGGKNTNLDESAAKANESPDGPSDEDGGAAVGPSGGGTGVTIATSKARMWLARYAMRQEDFTLANRLASELCQDGVEVEEAKALIRETRARLDAEAAEQPAG